MTISLQQFKDILLNERPFGGAGIDHFEMTSAGQANHTARVAGPKRVSVIALGNLDGDDVVRIAVDQSYGYMAGQHLDG